MLLRGDERQGDRFAKRAACYDATKDEARSRAQKDDAGRSKKRDATRRIEGRKGAEQKENRHATPDEAARSKKINVV